MSLRKQIKRAMARRAVRQTSFHNVESRPDDDIEAWALRKQLAELGAQ